MLAPQMRMNIKHTECIVEYALRAEYEQAEEDGGLLDGHEGPASCVL